MRIDRTQAEALAAFVIRVRTDWSHGGVMAAIEPAADGDPLDVARALVNLAADRSMLTPALLSKPGPWWRNPAGENVAPPRNSMRCHEHPDHEVPCPACRAAFEANPPRPESIAAALQAARRARGAGDRAEQEIRDRRAS